MEAIKLNNVKEITYALYGLLLGDGSYSSGCIRIKHTNKQRFYILWLKKICKKNNLEYKLKLDYKANTTLGNFTYSDIYIYVPKRFYFESLNKFFGNNGKKIISDYVLNNISVLGLLFWYLDDGSLIVHKKYNKTSRFAYLNTQGYSLEENKNIQKMLKNRFDIDSSIHTDHSGIYKDRRYYRLYINATNFRKFYDLIRDYLDYIPVEFYYKFDMKYEPNRLKNSVQNTIKYNLISQ